MSMRKEYVCFALPTTKLSRHQLLTQHPDSGAGIEDQPFITYLHRHTGRVAAKCTANFMRQALHERFNGVIIGQIFRLSRLKSPHHFFFELFIAQRTWNRPTDTMKFHIELRHKLINQASGLFSVLGFVPKLVEIRT